LPIRQHRLQSRTASNMPLIYLNLVILVIVTTIVVARVAFIGSNNASKDRTGVGIHMVKRDVDYDENDTDSDEGFFFSIANFFRRRKHDDDKPDSITTFDIFRLLDEKYAMKQFYCVINEDPCDAVGMRLKGKM